MKLAAGEEMPDVLRRVPAARDRWQSRALVWVFGTLLAIAAVAPVVTGYHGLAGLRPLAAPLRWSAAFAVATWGPNP